jgi:hypothetical protein
MSADGDDPSAVNAIEVTTVSAGYDTPVLDVRDGLFDDKAQQPDLRHWRGGERAGTTARSTRQGNPGWSVLDQAALLGRCLRAPCSRSRRFTDEVLMPYCSTRTRMVLPAR